MVDLVPVVPWWGEVIAVVLGLSWILSWGVRARNRLDADRTDQSLRAMAKPARKDVRRIGGLFTGLLFIVWAITQELASVGGDVFGLAGEVFTSYPDFAGFTLVTLVGVKFSGPRVAGLALVIGALVLMTKN